MCESCGCGDRSGHAHHHGHADGVHFHRDADGNLYSHRHSSAERVPLGTAILANIVLGTVADKAGWDWTFVLLIGACLLAIVFMAFTCKREKERH